MAKKESAIVHGTLESFVRFITEIYNVFRFSTVKFEVVEDDDGEKYLCLAFSSSGSSTLYINVNYEAYEGNFDDDDIDEMFRSATDLTLMITPTKSWFVDSMHLGAFTQAKVFRLLEQKQPRTVTRGVLLDAQFAINKQLEVSVDLNLGHASFEKPTGRR